MNILLATYWPIPHLGGVWNYMVQLKDSLELLGHSVDLLGYDEDNHSVYIVNENRKIARENVLPLLETHLNGKVYPEIHANQLVQFTEFQRYVYELSAAYLGLDKYDIIHAQDVLSSTCIARVKPKNVALVSTLHGSVAHDIYHQLTTIHQSDNSFIAKEYFNVIENLGATSGDETIVANHWLKNILIKEFQVPEDYIKILHYGFDSEKFMKEMEQESNIEHPKNKKLILYVGRLVELKGVQNLISALGKLKSEQKDWVCWIVGDGNYISELKLQCQSLRLEEDILFLGRRDDIPYLLTLADIFVYPSLLENQPLSVIEAQIAGKAIIVSDSGGLPEIVRDGITGLVYPANNIDELSKRIDYLLKNEKHLIRLGMKAKKWAIKHWSIDRGVKNLIHIYESAISKRKNDDTFETPNFPTSISSTIQQLVEPEVWQNIEHTIPKNYSIPNPASLKILKNLYSKISIETSSNISQTTNAAEKEFQIESSSETNSEPIEPYGPSDEPFSKPNSSYNEPFKGHYKPCHPTFFESYRTYNQMFFESYSPFNQSLSEHKQIRSEPYSPFNQTRSEHKQIRSEPYSPFNQTRSEHKQIRSEPYNPYNQTYSETNSDTLSFPNSNELIATNTNVEATIWRPSHNQLDSQTSETMKSDTGNSSLGLTEIISKTFVKPILSRFFKNESQ